MACPSEPVRAARSSTCVQHEEPVHVAVRREQVDPGQHPHQVADPEAAAISRTRSSALRPAGVAGDVVGDRVADQEAERRARCRRTRTCARTRPTKPPPGASRSSTSVIQPTFHSSGFQTGTGWRKIGSTRAEGHRRRPRRTARGRGRSARRRPGARTRPEPAGIHGARLRPRSGTPSSRSARAAGPAVVSVISCSESGPKSAFGQHAVREVLAGRRRPSTSVVRVDLVQRRLVAVEVDEVRVGDAVVQHVVQEEVGEHGLLRRRADRPAVVLDRDLAVRRPSSTPSTRRGRALGAAGSRRSRRSCRPTMPGGASSCPPARSGTGRRRP